MSENLDMGAFVAPKSNQLNADDLLAGPRTVRITKVSGTGNADQPVAVSYDGDGGKPYLPCKSMRRVMISAWTADTALYLGRSMTLYRDPKVAFGGMEVGGIRISHMSHIDRPLGLALTVTKAKRAPYVVQPLKVEAPPPAAPAKPDRASEMLAALLARIAGCHDADALADVTADAKVVEQRAWLAKRRPEMAQQVDMAVASALLAFEGA